MDTPKPRNNDLDQKNQDVAIMKKEAKKKLMIEEKQPKNSLPVGEGHETEVLDE